MVPLFLKFDFRQAQSPKSIIVITSVGTTTAIAIFWCAMWLSGLFVDVGVDTRLDSVEDVGADDWDEERDESEGDDEKSDEADDPWGRGRVVCATLEDNSDDDDDAVDIAPLADATPICTAPDAPITTGLSTRSATVHGTVTYKRAMDRK